MTSREWLMIYILIGGLLSLVYSNSKYRHNSWKFIAIVFFWPLVLINGHIRIKFERKKKT